MHLTANKEDKAPALEDILPVLRVALAGPTCSGKSSLLGCLLSGRLDDGCGLSRARVVRHPHEVFDGGRSSCVSRHLVGLDASARLVVGGSGTLGLVLSTPPAADSPGLSIIPRTVRNTPDLLVAAGRPSTGELACGRYTRLLSLVDLPGDSRYSRSMLGGLVGGAHDVVAILADARQLQPFAAASAAAAAPTRAPVRSRARASISSDMSLPHACTHSEEEAQAAAAATTSAAAVWPPPALQVHLRLAVALGVRACVVLTHADLVSDAALATAAAAVDDCVRLAAGESCRGGAGAVSIITDAAEARAAATASGAAAPTASPSLPIFALSNVTGAGLTPLLAYMSALPPEPSPTPLHSPDAAAAGAELRVQEVFSVDGSTVVAGLVVAGRVRPGDELVVGPLGSRGTFAPARVGSVHVHCAPAASASAGQLCTVQLLSPAGGNFERASLRRGQVLLGSPALASAAGRGVGRTFRASLRVCGRARGDDASPPLLRAGMGVTVQLGAARQTAVITGIRGGGMSGVNCRGYSDSLVASLRFVHAPELICTDAPVVVQFDCGALAAGRVLSLGGDGYDGGDKCVGDDEHEARCRSTSAPARQAQKRRKRERAALALLPVPVSPAAVVTGRATDTAAAASEVDLPVPGAGQNVTHKYRRSAPAAADAAAGDDDAEEGYAGLFSALAGVR